MQKRVRKKSRALRSAGWNAKAKALRFGDHIGVICFRECQWWHIDMTGARVGPISRREAYLTATSYMNAAEVASFGAEDLQRENEADWAAQGLRSASVVAAQDDSRESK